MDEIGYPPVRACLRAPRVAVAYRPDSGWVGTARRVIQSLSRVWGGAGAVMFPADEAAGIDPDLLGLLRSYDPDVIAGHVPLATDQALASGDAGPGDSADDPAAWQYLPRHLIDVDPWNDVARLTGQWCSPLKGVLQDDHSFQAHEIIPLDRQADSYEYLTVMPPLAGEPPVVALDLSGIDPVVALMIESRTGALDAHDQDRVQPMLLRVEDADLAPLVRMAITGQARLSGWNPSPRYPAADGVAAPGQGPALTAEQFLQRTPFARTRHGLARLQTFGAAPPPVVCVVGDTAADHALAVACDRLFRTAAWIPLSVLRDPAHASAVRLGVHELAYIPGSPRRPVIATSTSEPLDTLRSLLPQISAGPSVPGEPREGIQVIAPGDLAGEPCRSLLADPTHFQVTRRIPARREAGAVSFLMPLDLPVPGAIDSLPDGAQWLVDVALAGHQVPARTAITPSLLTQVPLGAIPDALVRAGRYGTTFCSANMGFVMAGGPVEGRLAHPMLQFPSAEQVFAELAAASGRTAHRSDAGRRAANATELWGSFDAIIADLTGPVRGLLDAFLPPKGKKDGDYGRGYAIRGAGYLHFGHTEAALGLSRDDTRDALDRLTGLDVLRRGFLLACDRCRWQAFYPVDQVGKTFTCAACSHVSNLASGTWYKGDSEPAWNYSLDQVVRTLLEQHGDIPMLAADRLRQGTRDFLWAPELAIHGQGEKIEIDICAIINGRVIVGEAKSNGRLDSGDKSAQQAADRLIQAAQVLTADEVVLATSEPRWAPGALAAVKTALDTCWSHGPRPKLTDMTSLAR